MSRAGTKGPYTVITNGHERPMLRWDQLTDTERERFDYIDTEQRQEEAEFVRYRGWTFDVNDTEGLAPDDLRALGWDVWLTDSFFSATVFCHHDKDGHYLDESIIVGRVYT